MRKIPEPSRKRLIQLSQLLGRVQTERLTSAQIQELTGWSAAVVRRDISLLGLARSSSAGYNPQQLAKAIRSALSIADSSEQKRCCIVGLGRLGAALLETQELTGSSFVLAAGFDSNVNRTEVLKSSVPLYPASQLETVIAAQGIAYAILAVPDSVADKTARRLEKCGIRGIVNYTDAVLSCGVAVENVSLSLALHSVSAQDCTAE